MHHGHKVIIRSINSKPKGGIVPAHTESYTWVSIDSLSKFGFQFFYIDRNVFLFEGGLEGGK